MCVGIAEGSPNVGSVLQGGEGGDGRRGDWWLLSDGKAAHIISYSRRTEELIGDERKG